VPVSINLCPCGVAAEDSSILCARCAALQILELPAGATQEEIKAAYHLLVKVWHPDRFQGDKKLRESAEEKLKLINSTYLFLTSDSARTAQRRSPRSYPSPAARWEPFQAVPRVANPSPSSQPAPSASPRRSAARSVARPVTRSGGVLQTLLAIACVGGLGGLLLKVIDSRLPPKPEAIEVSATDKAAPAINSAAIQPAPVAATSVSRSGRKVLPAPVRIQPLITVGLTMDEVIAIAGTPASSTGDKIAYQGSEFYFKGGKVAGWKIDPATSPVRVKVWPDASVDTSLQFFTVGSTRDDVLAVEGTPTTLLDDTFGYGGSEVYFQRNRVVSWKDDPASAPLRAVNR
jgi:hypothetical protein